MIQNKNLSLSEKGLGALALIFTLAVQLVIPVFSTDSPKIEKETVYVNEITLLEKLGIFKEEDGMQYGEEYVTREDFASMLGVFYGVSRQDAVTSFGRGLYEDVNTKAGNCALIEKLSDIGVMEGYKDGKFRPTANLTVEQAVKSFVILTGYDVTVLSNSSEFSGYTKKGRELDLLDEINKEYSAPITKAELTKMFMTALDTEILQLKTLGYETKYETVKGETLLSKKLGVYKVEGILQATDITGIGSFEACRNGYILADGVEIRTGEDMNPYLGKDMEIYCTGEADFSELEIIYFYPKEKKNQELIIDAENIENAENNVIYYEDNGKVKKVKLQEELTVIYNGKNYPLYSDDTFKIEEGNVRLLDADCDGKYEVMFIKEYFRVWVGGVYNDNGKIYVIDENNPKIKYSFDTEDESKNIVFIKDNSKASFSDITSKSVLMIAADKMDTKSKEISNEATYYEVLISNKHVSGVVEGYDKEEKKIKIEGVLYDVSADFDLKAYDISIRKSAKFYLDAYGKITAAEKGQSNLYGILDKAFADESGEYIAGIKMFTADGAFKTLECAKKITIDSIKLPVTEIDLITEKLEDASKKFFLQSGMSKTGASSQFQLVKYSTNSDGQLVMIDTLTPDSEKNETEKNNLKFSKKFEKDTRYFSKANATTIDGGYVYDSNIIVFRLPNDKSKKEAFAKKSGLNSLGYEVLTVPVYAFDANEFNYIPVLIAESDTVDNVPQKEDNNMMILETVTTELGDDEECYNVMNGTSIKSGTKIKALMDEEAYLNFTNLGIESGDIVRWSLDDLNVVTSIELLVKNEGNESNITIAGNTAGINATGYYSDFRITCGTVEKFDDKYILFNLGGKKETSLRNPSAKVLVYDKKTKKTEPGDYSAIKTNETFGNEASLVFTYQWYTAINTIVIFN